MPELVTIHNGEWPLSGVVHTPRSRPEPRVGVVLLHENFNTKFGTHRIFYQLGEALADNGLYALRYDNRGTCDSPQMHPLTFLDRVEDACTASKFFMNKYELDSVLFWGLCMGTAVAVYASERLGPERPGGMMLCSIWLIRSKLRCPSSVMLRLICRNLLNSACFEAVRGKEHSAS